MRIAVVVGLLATVLQVSSAYSQIGAGASLTVVQGSVAVTQSDGTKIFPAGSGLTLAIGDIVGTLERTRAIVTFFSGSEVELGSNTTIVIRGLDRDLLDQANVTIENLTGAALIRVPTENGANPGVRILGRDTVAIVRNGEVGHGVDPTTNNVTAACMDGEYRCTRDSVTFPNVSTFLVGQTSTTVTGAGQVVVLRLSRSASIWDALADGAAIGREDGTDSRPSNRDDKEDDDKPNQPQSSSTSTPTPSPGVVVPTRVPPTPTPPAGNVGPPCNTQTDSGGAGVTTTVHSIGRSSGVVQINWNAFGLADRFEIFYEGAQIFDSPGGATGVTGVGSGFSVPFSGTSTFIQVRVTAIGGSTQWNYTIPCLP